MEHFYIDFILRSFFFKFTFNLRRLIKYLYYFKIYHDKLCKCKKEKKKLHFELKILIYFLTHLNISIECKYYFSEVSLAKKVY